MVEAELAGSAASPPGEEDVEALPAASSRLVGSSLLGFARGPVALFPHAVAAPRCPISVSICLPRRGHDLMNRIYSHIE